MNRIPANFVTKWELRLPTVVRYLAREYADAFFEHGELRIASFKAFQRHPDETRRDVTEGNSMVESRPNGIPMLLAGAIEQESYVLCGCVVESSELAANFRSDAAIRITHTTAFARAVAAHIPGCLGGMEGLCAYSVDGLSRVPPDALFPDGAGTFGSREAQARMTAAHNDAMLNALFQKRLQFAAQLEYRWIWISGGAQQEYLTIRCPEARRFCERVNFNAYVQGRATRGE